MTFKIYASAFISILLLSFHAMADQNGVCVLRGGNHKAFYNCPDNFEVVIVGDGTMQCDGNCYRKDDLSSLNDVLAPMLMRRNVLEWSSSEFYDAARSVIDGRCSSISLPNGEELSVCAGMGLQP